MHETLVVGTIKVNIATADIETHARLSETPERWQYLVNAVRDAVQQVMVEGQTAKAQERDWDRWQEDLRWTTVDDPWSDVYDDAGTELIK